jgi:hypothetical protein
LKSGDETPNIIPDRCGALTKMKMLSVLIAILFCACSAERNSDLTEASVPAPGCTSQPNRAAPMELAQARALWSSCRIDDYDVTMSYEPGGFLEPARPVLVKVRNGAKVSVEVPDKTDGRGIAFYGPYHTVESMFDRVETLRREATGSTIMTVRYNDLYGYPEEIKYSEPNPDAFFTFRVLELRPVGADGL